MFRRMALFLFMLLLSAAGLVFCATPHETSAKGFFIEPSSEWMELPLPFQGVVVSYGKKGTLATFHITVRDLEDVRSPNPSHSHKAVVETSLTSARTVDQLKWEDLFSPQFQSIDIHNQNVTILGGQKARFCVYSLKPGEFKRTMEGKLPAKYINYVLLHNGKLFSITFKDTEEGFALNYPSFMAAIRTLRFDAVPSMTAGRKS